MKVATNNSKRVSTHGTQLLKELADPLMAKDRLDHIVSLIVKDPLAGLLKSKELGNNAWHFVLNSAYPDSFVLPVLESLMVTSPGGVKALSKSGLTPLHVASRRPNSCGTPDTAYAIFKLLVDAYPVPLGVCPEMKQDGGPPLIAYLKRRGIPNPRIVQLMCEASPDVAPCTLDKDKNTPLHVTVQKSIIEALAEDNLENLADSPENVRVLRLLLQLYPEAAKMGNVNSSLPLHIICANTTNVDVVKMVYEAYPTAARIADNMGRTCLHHAVLAVGKCQTEAVSAEERELLRLKDLQIAAKNAKKGHKGGMSLEEREAYKASFGTDQIGAGEGEGEGEDEDEEDDLGIWGPEPEACSGAHALKEDLGVDRRVVTWLVEVWPEALVRLNNFGFTPVETVLEKTKNMVTKRKVVQVFGLYDDPPTARILLLAQCRLRKLTLRGVKIDSRAPPEKEGEGTGAGKDVYGNDIQAFRMPAMRPRYLKPFAELNYFSRREALLASFCGHTYPCPAPLGAEAESAGKKQSEDASSKRKKKGRHQPQNKSLQKRLREAAAAKNKVNGAILPHNTLARLRGGGHIDCVRFIIEFL